MASTGPGSEPSTFMLWGERLCRRFSVRSQRALWRTESALASTAAPSAQTVSTAPPAPCRHARRPEGAGSEPALRTTETRSSRPPAMSSAQRKRVSQGTSRQTAREATRDTTAAGKAQRFRTLTGLPFPALRVERAKSEEQRERRHREVVDHVLGVDDAFAESVLVLEDGQILQAGAGHSSRRIGAPPDEPEAEQRTESGGAGHDLVLGERGNEDAHREERRPQQEETEIPRED